MSAPWLQAMQAGDLLAVHAVEQASHAHPWSHGNFADSLRDGHWAHMLLRPPQSQAPASWHVPQGARLLGHAVAWLGVDDVHVLNLTVAPDVRRQGHASRLLQAVRGWAQHQAAHAIWLEVRVGNAAARALYRAAGYEEVATRARYYPLSATQREDAVVMRMPLPVAI
ncbi:MAG: ribosomal protein S18-alanine N-acetyltransferase [Burkholderiaceae bacterium]